MDLFVFRELASRGRRRLRDADCDTAVELLRDALGLWRGGAGADLPHTRRFVAFGDLLDGERTAVVEDLGRAAIRAGYYRLAITELEREIVEQPLRESVWALLACAHYLSGNAAVAQATVRRGLQALEEFVGIGPGIGMRGVEEAAVLRDDRWFEEYLVEPSHVSEIGAWAA